MIERLVVKNFKLFRELDFTFDDQLTVLVGDNDTGKSTVVEALEMVLRGRLGGRLLEGERTPHWFNLEASLEYLNGLKTNPKTALPAIVIEAYLKDDPGLAIYKGKNNSLKIDVPGIRIDIHFDAAYGPEYEALTADPEKLTSIPVEFFRIDRRDFAGQTISGPKPLVRATIIDASTLRLQSGTDYYLRRSISEHLTVEARAKLSLALRSYREQMMRDSAFTDANASISAEQTTLRKKTLTLSADASPRSSWEAGVVPHLDDVPFEHIGQGEQSAFKILLALHKDDASSHVVVVEEPENHLSHGNLNALIERIRERSVGQQLIITTHSSFVLNKLGIDKLRLLSGTKHSTLSALSAGTREYFLRLAGYDTLRLVLARAVILVEGPSDELIVQRAYLQEFKRMPITDGVDVISVQSLAFKRFLELAKLLDRRTAVVTDLDDDLSDAKARERFKDFETLDVIQGFVPQAGTGRTIEDQLIAAMGLANLNGVLDTAYPDDAALRAYMSEHKTEAALKIFETDQSTMLALPRHIVDAIKFVHE